MSNPAGTIIGNRYEILESLGRGSFGHTFSARDGELNRTVAVKVLDSRAHNDAKAYELFRREADVLRAVRHHGIPEVFDTLQDAWNGAPAFFLVMEYVEGASLAQIIEERRVLDRADVVHVFLELLGVLDYLHGRVPPILHRDIKPSNIIIRPNGFPALVDFGSVRRVFMGPEESGSTVAGTYGYMPYEQYMGQATPASDLFATAATLLHLLTGRPPRDFMTDEGRIEVPETIPAEPRLRHVIARLLRASPAERYGSAREVRDALIGAENSLALVPPRTPTVTYTQDASAVEAIRALPPVPRELTGETKKMMLATAPGALRLMASSEKFDDHRSFWWYSGVVFFSVLTAGIMPIVFMQMAGVRRRRMKRFFRDGLPTTAEVLKTETLIGHFDEKLTRVSYQFEADGALHRDSDTLLPVIADRWQPGDRIPVLYLPGRRYDSVVIAVE